jgi:hypothetical protein
MKKRSLLTSVVVSSVLVGALAFSGCGGSNKGDSGIPKVSDSRIGYVKKAEVTQTIKSGAAVEIPVTATDANGNNVEVAKIKISKGLDGCSEATPCSVKAVQTAAVAVSSEVKTKANNLRAEVPQPAKVRKVLFAGSLVISDDNVLKTQSEGQVGLIGDNCEMDVTVKLPAKALRPDDGGEVNVWDCDIMKIYVKPEGSAGYWATGNLIVEDHQGCHTKDRYVTFKFKGGLPADILIFALRMIEEGVEGGTTGVSGGTGGTGY